MKSLFCNKVVLGLCLLVSSVSVNAFVIDIEDFTGDDTSMEVTFTDQTNGVQIDFAFAAGSLTGDITGVWLGLDDTLFDPTVILDTDVELIAPSEYEFSVNQGFDGTDTGTGGSIPNLNGGPGPGNDYVLQFDLDLAIFQENKKGSDKFDFLSILITTDNLLAEYFDAAGARVQSIVGGTEKSSKLAGGVTPVPLPGALGLVGFALVFLGSIKSNALLRIRRTMFAKQHKPTSSALATA